jgi:hypothetical protein
MYVFYIHLAPAIWLKKPGSEISKQLKEDQEVKTETGYFI